jgi:hypothetical protein
MQRKIYLLTQDAIEVARHEVVAALNSNNFLQTQLNSSLRMAPRTGALPFAQHAARGDSNIVSLRDLDTATSSSCGCVYST